MKKNKITYLCIIGVGVVHKEDLNNEIKQKFP